MLAAGADGNGRDRTVFAWRDCVLAEAVAGTGLIKRKLTVGAWASRIVLVSEKQNYALRLTQVVVALERHSQFPPGQPHRRVTRKYMECSVEPLRRGESILMDLVNHP